MLSAASEVLMSRAAQMAARGFQAEEARAHRGQAAALPGTRPPWPLAALVAPLHVRQAFFSAGFHLIFCTGK